MKSGARVIFSTAVFLLCAASLWADGWMGADSTTLQRQWSRLPAGIAARPLYGNGKLRSVEFYGSGLEKNSALFSLLDSLNGNGEWSEIDAQGFLEPMLKIKVKGARQAWFSWVPGQPPQIVVLQGKPGVLKAEAVPSFTIAKAVPLTYRYTGGLEPFADFERYEKGGRCGAGDPCTLIHREDNDLQVIVEGRHVRMGYRNPDVDGLAFPTGFAQYSDQEKVRVVSEYRDFFRHELAVMLRAFIHTSPGLFNWQPWHWPAFSEKYLITSPELYALFNTGHAPSLFRVMQLRCSGGETVRFETDGNGAFYMEIQ